MKIPTPVVKHFGRATLKIQRNSPTILLVAGVAGVVSSTVMACKATLKLESIVNGAHDKIDKINEMQDPAYTATDRVKDLRVVRVKTAMKIVQVYSPAIGLSALSLGCLVGSHRILSARNAGLMAAYATLEKGFEEYRARVLEEVGEEKEKEIRYGGDIEEIVTPDGRVQKIRPSASIYARFFDEFSSNWTSGPSHVNQFFIQCQQNYANDLLRTRGHVFLNEVYDMLGISRSPEGQIVGWVLNGDGDGHIDFGVFQGNEFEAIRFVNGDNDSILLDFNVDGVVYNKI